VRKESEIVCRKDPDGELATMVDAALAPVAPTMPPAVIEQLKAAVVHVARQHAARAVHDTILARTSAREARHAQRRRRR